MADRKRSRFTEEQVIGFVKPAEAGMEIKELCRKGGFSNAMLYKWRAKFGGMDMPDARLLREVEARTPSSRSPWRVCPRGVRLPHFSPEREFARR